MFKRLVPSLRSVCVSRASRRSWLLGGGLLLWSAMASAVGLGDLSLHSALNQPFNADIELVDSAGLEEGELSARLASAEAFEKAGFDKPFFLSDLRFTPVFRGNRKYIHVSSSKPALEPYLQFLVQVDRPGGQLLRGYTVLLDPPGTVRLDPPLPPAAPARSNAQAEPAGRAQPATPAAPLPAATQNKRYLVQSGDSLWAIGKQLNGAGTPGSATELARAIRALNPRSEPLKAGDSLLLPDTAVLAPAPAATPVADTPAAVDTPEQLAATVLQNQQLEQNLEALQGQMKTLADQMAERDKQVAQLQADLAQARAPAPAAVPPPVAAATPAAPAPSAFEEDDSLPWLQILALLALVVLLVAWLILRRRRAAQRLEPEAQEPFDEGYAAPVAASVAVAAAVAAEPAQAAAPQTVPARRDGAPATDALDGASIYIAYGRLNEALTILREGLAKEPERTDLRLRMLEVLGQQGDARGYAEQERHLLAAGVGPQVLAETRARYPKIEGSQAVAQAERTPAPEVVPEAVPEPAPQPPAQVPEDDIGELLTLDLSDLEQTLEADPEAISSTDEPKANDEFQLNLDDLPSDADWAELSPFDAAPAGKSKAAGAPAAASELVEPDFATNLKELPEVLEMPEEQYLSDFAEETPEPAADTSLDDEFLNQFVADADLPDLDELTVDFDAIDQQHASADKLELAQAWIARGDTAKASRLLEDLLIDGDDFHRKAARELLASLE